MLFAASLLVGVAGQIVATDSATPGPQLWVDTTADAALACPAGAALADALRKRLPGVRVGTRGTAGAGDLSASLRRDAHWVLALGRADGEAVLVRDLAHGPSQCQALAEAAALVIDRFLSDLAWPGLVAHIDPSALAEPRPVPPQTRPAPPAPPPFWRGATLALGPALRAIHGESVDIGGYVQAGLLMPHGLAAEIEALAYSTHRNFVIVDDPVTGPRKLGSLVTRSTTAWSGLSVCRGTTVFGCAQARAGATHLEVSPRGRDLHAKEARSAWRPVFGAGVAVGYALPWRLEVVTTLRGMRVLGPVALRVDGLNEPAYSAPGFAWLMSLGLRRTFF